MYLSHEVIYRVEFNSKVYLLKENVVKVMKRMNEREGEGEIYK